MKVKDKRLEGMVDVLDKNYLKRKCYWPREDPGVFNQGQGYKFRPNDWLCGTREIMGCPRVVVKIMLTEEGLIPTRKD